MLYVELDAMEYAVTMEDIFYQEYLENGLDDFDDDEEKTE